MSGSGLGGPPIDWVQQGLVMGATILAIVLVATAKWAVDSIAGRESASEYDTYDAQVPSIDVPKRRLSLTERLNLEREGKERSESYCMGSGRASGRRPKNVGILAAEVYFPSTYVRQQQLERAHGVSQGKFTSGLGQSGMAFVGDREDINSIALTVVENLLSKYDIPKERIGRLEVGTETLVDRAKSTKTVLMSLFEESGNTDIEGTTVVNTCYGGTAALLNALAWVESSGWDGRYAIVVAADIAIYADGPAKPTGGCGAVALLIGPDAPLVIDAQLRATHASNTWDFFKPKFASEYPEVDGKLSKECYLRALDDCYTRFASKQEEASGQPFTADALDYFCFHHPYNKLVQKAFGRLYFMDSRRGKLKGKEAWSSLGPWEDAPVESTYDDRDLETLLRGLSHERFNKRVSPSCLISMQVGNTYTASVYMNLVCLVAHKAHELPGKRIFVYSFGSGALATAFQITARVPTSSRYTLQRIADTVNLLDRLHERETVTPEELSEAIRIREKNVNRGGFIPQYSVSSLFPGTYYLEEVRSDFTRVYLRKPLTAPRIKGLFYPLHANKVVLVEKVLTPRGAKGEIFSPRVLEVDIDDGPPSTPSHSLDPHPHPHPATTPLSSSSTQRGGRAGHITFHLNGSDLDRSGLTPSHPSSLTPYSSKSPGPLKSPSTAGLLLKSPAMAPHLTSEETLHAILHASLSAPQQRVGTPIAITGIAAGLPGRHRNVFQPDNLRDLVSGVQFITPLSDETKQALVDRHVVQLKKMPDGKTLKLPVDSPDKTIQLAAQLGSFDLRHYGVPESLVSTMDTVVQIGIAAGLEALKDAGLVKGLEGDMSSWQLPESMRDSTGVVYATSFPALEAAVSEVMRFLHSKQKSLSQAQGLLRAVRAQLESACGGSWEAVSTEDQNAYEQLEASLGQTMEDPSAEYEFDRKFLFRILVLGNAQLAQVIGARGPNMQTNAACAGTTQAIAIGQDIIQQGRCERLVIIASDNASGDTLIPWLGSGFRALGAATIASDVKMAALPFDKRRSGMILGAGAIGIVLETEAAVARRFAERAGLQLSPSLRNPNASSSSSSSSAPAAQATPTEPPSPVVSADDALKGLSQSLQVRLLDTQYSNSAYHGAALDKEHIASELERFLCTIQRKFGVTREAIAKEGCYLSHETMTHASDASSCAANEVYALRRCFGDAGMESLILLNTKGFTGHPMGVSFEDVAAVEILRHGVIPPIANFNAATVDPYLGKVRLGLTPEDAAGYKARYALRFAAGFGSQVAFALYANVAGPSAEPPSFYEGMGHLLMASGQNHA